MGDKLRFPDIDRDQVVLGTFLPRAEKKGEETKIGEIGIGNVEQTLFLVFHIDDGLFYTFIPHLHIE